MAHTKSRGQGKRRRRPGSQRQTVPARLLEGTVRDLAFGGDGAVETPEGVWLVPGALPGERVRLRSLSRRRGALRGELVQVIEPSTARVAAPCSLQTRCGGCPWMTLSLEAQHAAKVRWVEAAVAPVAVGGLAVSMTPSARPLGYRARARWSFAADGHPRMLGYRRRADARVLDVANCAVVSDVLQGAVDVLRSRILPELVGRGEIELGTGRQGRAVARIRVSQAQPPRLYTALRDLVNEPGARTTDGTDGASDGPAFAGVVLSFEDGASEESIGEPDEWRAGHDGQGLLGVPGGFTQANDGTNGALVDWVRDAADARGLSVLELYAGHGNFTVALAGDAARVTAIEQHPGQARYCAENIKRRGLTGVKVVNADVTPLPSLSGIDVVVLDPPRTGAKSVLEGVLALRPKRIVYVSCDPPTLGRDLRILHAGGYQADRARAFDMFPQTAHVEAAVRMHRERA